MEILVNPVSLLIVFPLAAAFLTVVLPRLLSKWINLFVAVSLVVWIAILYGLLPLSMELRDIVLMKVDTLGYFSLVFVQILAVIFALYLLKSPGRIIPAFFMITVAFTNGALASSEPITFIVFWGLTGFMLYLFGIRKKVAADASRKALMISGLSDAMLIFGFFALAGTTNGVFSVVELRPETGTFWGVCIFASIALASFAKAGAFPLHVWVPGYCEKSPIEGTAILPASFDKIIGIYLFARLMWHSDVLHPAVGVSMALIGAFTIISGVMMALVQHDGKKLLGYHAVSQVGYMILGIATGNPVGIAGGLLHTINNATYKSGLFMGMGNVELSSGTTDLDELGGLSRRMPATFSGMLVNSLSISGLPPTNGFVSKWLVYQGVLIAIAGAGTLVQLLLTICLIMALFGSALTLASFMKLTYSVFLVKPASERFERAREPHWSRSWAVLLNAGLCLFIGVAWFFFPLRLIQRIPGLESLNYLGTYSVVQYLGIVALIAVAGWIVFRVFKKVRVDEAFVGGQRDQPSFKVSGVGFFNEVRKMSPLESIYRAAEKGLIDIYELTRGAFRKIPIPLKKLHTGELSFYSLWIVVGFLVLLLVMM